MALAPRRAALFDMDRTLIRRDSASLYVRYRRDTGRARRRDVAKVGWWLLKYTLGVIDAQRVAKSVARGYAGRSEAKMRDDCRRWFHLYARQHVPEAAREAVRMHQRVGDLVAIVTGASPYVAAPLAEELGIERVLCTRLEVEGERFTGRVVEPMCYGAGKVTLASHMLAEADLDLGDSVFYSDSITDLPLLESVAKPVVVNPDARLQRIAWDRSWLVERW